MPDYRKRKHSKLAPPKRAKKTTAKTANQTEEIKMTSSKGKPQTDNTNMKVLKGRREENRRKAKAGAIAVSAILIIIIALELILPAGIAEGISKATSLLGTGSYPIELSSTETLATVSKGSYYYVLTNTDIIALTNSGKPLFSYTHGYENPLLKVSSSRAMVIEQGGTEALIFDLKKLKSTIKTEKPIVTGVVSDSGSFALVTTSDKYTSEVIVYNKREKVIYEWYSAENTVNNVALSPNGKKIAVSAFKVSGGQFISTLNVLNFKSATAEYSESYENTLIYNIDSSFKSGFNVVTENAVKFIKWHKFKAENYKNEYPMYLYRSGKNGTTAVFNRESDKTDNKIALFSRSGKLISEFEFSGVISDIAVLSNHIYCMSDTEIFLINKEGKVLRKTDCGFGTVRLNAASQNSVIVITDNKIEKLALE